MIHCIQCGGIVILSNANMQRNLLGGDLQSVIYRAFCKDCKAIHEISVKIVGVTEWQKPAPMHP